MTWGLLIDDQESRREALADALRPLGANVVCATSVDDAITSFLDEERPYMELKRRGEPDEVANVIAFLCSEAASFVNGSNYRVDSGSVATV